ncbi:MAG: electron transport complex subunit RsxE [Clostridiales bacterium]|nr:electron transport complex subunit RsxE [Clostridiales bacterium]
MTKQEFKKTALGGLTNNPVFVLVLGMCPTIAKSDNIINAVSLGLCTAFVLVFSNLIISLLRKVIPDKVHLPAYIIIIASLVTLVQMVVSSFLPSLNDSIGAFIALITVNCIILGRAEAFAGKNKVLPSVIDGVSMGIGFIASITLLGAVRQGLCAVMGSGFFDKTMGGFIVLGLMMAVFNAVFAAAKRARTAKTALIEREAA